ncbi:MAG: tRNA pseudouridine(38-40) synthase TruA [Prevotella sp.]|nr:tRNA pseudouridine(38-40) synthase TruA [Prevotella sp.]
MRYFIHLAYDGTNYHGWQIQPDANSVQEELQKALSVLIRREIEIVGAGRTDAGVHARRMVAHFDFDGPLDCQQTAYRLGRMLPRDIAVYRIEPVAAGMHARFSATCRTYHYYLHTERDPFCRQYSCELHYELDFQLMNEAGRILCTYNDFGAFCKSHSDVKTTLCHVTEARWIQVDSSHWYFRISANRFLRNMVRAVVGTMIDVGRHRVTLDEFHKIVEGKQRTQAGESMPAHALFLEDVAY